MVYYSKKKEKSKAQLNKCLQLFYAIVHKKKWTCLKVSSLKFEEQLTATLEKHQTINTVHGQ